MGDDNVIYGSRLFPKSGWDDEESFNRTFGVWKESVELGFTTLSFQFAPKWAGVGEPDNAVLPAWRDAWMHSMFRSFFSFGH